MYAGDFTWAEPSGPGTFRYLNPMLSSYRHLPLDPIALPVTPQPKTQVKQAGVFGVFRDSAPDAWGAYQLKKRLNLEGDPTPFQRLTEGNLSGAGCISVGELTEARMQKAWTLSELEAKAYQWATEQQPPDDILFNRFLQVASPATSLGGAKPKLEVEIDGELWIIKFPDLGDPKDFAAVEATALTLAAECGIETPKHRVLPMGFGERRLLGLLVKRFDRHRVEGGHARLGYASAHTVMQLDTGVEGHAIRSYLNFSHEAGRWCARGDSSVPAISPHREIWRRMVFNALVNNVDDHPRNHALISENGRWRLSPVFDVVPAVYTGPARHLSMGVTKGDNANRISRESLLASVSVFKWGAQEAADELMRMAMIVTNRWETLMRGHGASEETIRHRASAFDFALGLVVSKASSPEKKLSP